MVTQQPEVSVVIPTFRRPEGLRRCLAALAPEIATAEFAVEVVVVDNDPGGAHAATIRRLVTQAVANGRVVTEARAGASHARNRGIAEAAAPVVAMLDDDVWPQPGWLDRITRPIRSGEAAGAGGPVRLDPAVDWPTWLDADAAEAGGVGGYLTAHDLGPSARELDYFADLVVTANAAWRRDVLQSVGGFDPAFGPRGRLHLVGDDARLTRQVIGHGGRVVWCPDAVVIHELPRDRLRLAWLARRAWWQGRSDWRLERLDLAGRRFGGRVAGVKQVVEWLRQEGAKRRAEGLQRPPVAVHALLDGARMAGRLWEIATLPTGTSGAGSQTQQASWSLGGDSAGHE